MTSQEALEKLLPMYGDYYTIKTENATAPFAAEAECLVKDEQLTAFRLVKISSVVSREIVFFATVGQLEEAQAQTLCETAWQEGLKRTEPGPNHRNTDTVLILLAEQVSPAAARRIRKLHRTKNYRFSFHGWSVLRVVAIETSSGKMTVNRMGQSLKKLFGNINFL